MSAFSIVVAAIAALSLAANAYFLINRRNRFERSLKEFVRRSADGRVDLATSFTWNASADGTESEIMSSLNTLYAKLSENFKKTFSVGYQLTKTSDATKQVSNQLRDMSDKLSGRASQVAAAMEEMSSTINEIAKNAAQVATAGESSSKNAEAAKASIDENVRSIELLSENVSNWAETNRALSAATDRIDKIILVINEIAGQTNLLALNAAIEAARAGEQGRGFAVVADEVRKLADKTGTATREIADMIRDVKEKSGQSVESMDVTLKQAEENRERSRSVAAALSTITAEIKKTVDMIQTIATASEEQAQVSEDVLKNMEQVSGHASEAKELAMSISSSGDSVAALAHTLYSQLCSVKKDPVDCSMEERLVSWAASMSDRLEESLRQGRLNTTALFDENYRGTNEPDKFAAGMNTYFENEVLPLLKTWSQADKRITYVVAMDRNGYMPTHTNPARARVKMNDTVSQTGAKSTIIVGQAFRRPVAAGGELVVDIAAPVFASGRHWGCVRIGYLPDMVQ